MRRWSQTVLATGFAAALVGLAACAQVESDDDGGPWRVRVVEAYLHDPNAFTQGLAARDGRLYEGTGQYGRSSLRAIEIASGRVERLVPLDAAYFGEGITILGDYVYQLTWQNGIGFVYAIENFDPIRSFRYEGEGWGLCNDGRLLIMSDGTATLKFLDPTTFEVVRRLDVRTEDGPLTRLNELEYVDGEIWANIWYDDRIARISPETGEVLGFLDLSGLYPRSQRDSEAVLNGIAHDPETDRLFVTGKDWPNLFEIEIVGR